MTKKQKKIVFGVFSVFIILIIVTLIMKGINNKDNIQEESEIQAENNDGLKYSMELEGGLKINTSKELNATKKYKNLEISNIQFTSKNGNSVILADIKNVGDTIQEEEIVGIDIIGAEGQVITTLSAKISKIEPGETKKLNTTVSADVVNAKNIEIKDIAGND